MALYTEFECSDVCRREAKNVKVKDWSDFNQQAFDRNLMCGIHTGALKRQQGSRWGSYYKAEIVPISDPRFATFAADYLARRKADHDAAVIRQQQRQKQDAISTAKAKAAAWEQRRNDAKYVLVRGSDMSSYNGQVRDGYKVIAEGKDPDAWRNIVVRVNQNDGVPSIIALSSTGQWSPNEARAIAEALVKAADIADALDIVNGPS
jgi:hypothetical protein